MERNQNPDPQSDRNPTPSWSSLLKRQSLEPHRPNLSTPGAVFVDSCNSTKGIAIAVVDANAVIEGGEKLSSFADKFVTVAEALAEIRDPVSRHRLSFIPFRIDSMEPSVEALNKVIKFARAIGDLQSLSDVDLKLIALTYSLEAQIHGSSHLRNAPPPVQVVNVKRLPEKDVPGWGSNVANLEEWEALEHQAEDRSDPHSRILPLKDLNLNIISSVEQKEVASAEISGETFAENQGDVEHDMGGRRRYAPKKKEVNVEGKKMVADGVDASQGEFEDDAGEWMPAVSRSTRRRFIRRKARREQQEAFSERENQEDLEGSLEVVGDQKAEKSLDVAHSGCCKEVISEKRNSEDDLSLILEQMMAEEDSLRAEQEEKVSDLYSASLDHGSKGAHEAYVDSNLNSAGEGCTMNIDSKELVELEASSQDNVGLDESCADDASSEQSWALRALSESSVACVTSDFAMQNVLLQMGLRLLVPAGLQIRHLHRWVLKCHACFTLTAEIGRIFCPKCGNGGTLRKVAVTVGENGIVLAARRPRISLRGTKFSLPLPQGGRDSITKNPILREDQLPQKYLHPKTKKKSYKQGDELFMGNDTFTHHTDKGSPLQPPMRKTLAVFSGRRNPNDNHYSSSKHK